MVIWSFQICNTNKYEIKLILYFRLYRFLFNYYRTSRIWRRITKASKISSKRTENDFAFYFEPIFWFNKSRSFHHIAVWDGKFGRNIFSKFVLFLNEWLNDVMKIKLVNHLLAGTVICTIVSSTDAVQVYCRF